MKQLLDVTDLCTYVFCKRKLWLKLVKQIKEPVNEHMVKGEIKHKIMEAFSKTEHKVVSAITCDYSIANIIEAYKQHFISTASKLFERYSEKISAFKLDKREMLSEFLAYAMREIKLRLQPISSLLLQGIEKQKLWLMLKPKYISEIKISSDELKLKGRIDRVKIDANRYYPYEMKSRAFNDVVYDSELVQVTAYALLLEAKYKQEVDTGFIEYSNKTKQITITNTLKQKVLQLRDEIFDLQYKDNMPLPSILKKCQRCNFRHICFG